MADLTTYEKVSKYTFVPLTIAVLALLGMNIQPDATHFCDSTASKAYCTGLSSGATPSRCYQNPEKTSWKSCSEGWKLMPPAPEAQPQVVTEVKSVTEKIYVDKVCPDFVSYTDQGKSFCNRYADGSSKCGLTLGYDGSVN